MTTTLFIIAWLLSGVASAYILRWAGATVLRWHVIGWSIMGMVGILSVLLGVVTHAISEYELPAWWKEKL